MQNLGKITAYLLEELAEFPDEADLPLELSNESPFKLLARRAGFKVYESSASFTLDYTKVGRHNDTTLRLSVLAETIGLNGLEVQFEGYLTDTIGGNYCFVFRDIRAYPSLDLFKKYVMLAEYLHSQLDSLVTMRLSPERERVYASELKTPLTRLAIEWKEKHSLN